MGAWLPLLSNHLVLGGRVFGVWLFGFFFFGVVFGALFGGFVLIPWMGTSATIVLAAAILFVCGAALARSPWVLVATPVLAVFAFPVISMPPVKTLLPTSQANVRDLARYEAALT